MATREESVARAGDEGTERGARGDEARGPSEGREVTGHEGQVRATSERQGETVVVGGLGP